tara:strand:+ start:954 stop:1583 length:630 start_codon:yes stop_codon:yes gene_type:complete
MKLTNESFDLQKSNTNELLDHLYSIVSKESFLHKQNPNNEIPFYICPFLPEYTLEVYEVINYLKKQLNKKEVAVLEIDLYIISIQILKNRKGNIFEKIQEKESQMNKSLLKETLQNILNTEKHLVPEIKKIISDHQYQILFIKGIGEVFPYIRSHNLLSNLQKILKNEPSLIFFPGSYQNDPKKGSSLNLFCKFYNDNYYRAFNILTMR